MERLTFDGNFCDIAQCRELPCPYGNNCMQKQVWERLKAYEDTGISPKACALAREIEDGLEADGYSIDRMVELMQADKDGRVVVMPDTKHCEQYRWQNITWDKKYGICAGSYNTREEAEKALEARNDARIEMLPVLRRGR